MDKNKIICPHCGTSQKVSLSQENVFCTFCGSSLKEVIKNLRNRFQSEAKLKTGTVQNQGTSESQNLPFTSQKQIPSFPRTEESPSSSNFPSPRNKPIPFQQSPHQTTFPQQKQFPAKLKFPQINKEIIIPANKSVFYFGRNSILPLVSPDKFDVEWLNSISRVKTHNNQVIHQHFILYRTDNGKYFIEDKNSRWGTWVNQTNIKGKGKIPLQTGDKIELMLSKPNVKQIIPFVIIFQF